MHKHTLVGIGIAGILVFSSAAFTQPASALTFDEIQTQIKELLAKIADLTRQLNELRAQQATTTPPAVVHPEPFKHRICNVLHRNMVLGTQGDDVRGLQEFLNSEGYLSSNATGYFGSITARAVAKWQESQGVQSIGLVGPMSRERIKIWCGGEHAGALKASPTSGQAPLTVNFWHVLGDSATTGYSIDFGDGSTGTLEIGCGTPPGSMGAACPRALVASHTYTTNGVYKAVLSKIIDLCGGNPACMAPVEQKIVGVVQIRVGAMACTKEYNPVCGLKPIVCITTPCDPVPTTYGNRCMMKADGASFLYKGQCKNTPACTPRPACLDTEPFCEIDIPNVCPKKCTPRPACLDATPRCLLPEPAEGWCPSHNQPPMISGFSGPTALRVKEQGTWTIQASDPENGTLSYHITWGDEGYATPTVAGMSAAREVFVQTTTFTHAYASAGTYTISIVVRDASGQEAKTSTTVKVGDVLVACTLQYDPVCGRPAGCANTCPDGKYCAMLCKLHPPQTYSNKCFLDAAGADLLHEGACTSADH